MNECGRVWWGGGSPALYGYHRCTLPSGHKGAHLCVCGSRGHRNDGVPAVLISEGSST